MNKLAGEESINTKTETREETEHETRCIVCHEGSSWDGTRFRNN